MKNSTTPSRLGRGIAFGLVITSLNFSLLLARAQSTAAPAKPQAERDAAVRADLDSLFDVQKPHSAVKKSMPGPDESCAPCPCQPAPTEGLQAPTCCPSPAVARQDPLEADVAALFDVQFPAEARKIKSADNK